MRLHLILMLDTYSDQDAVEISGLAVVIAFLRTWFSDHLRQASQPGHAQDVDVVLAAESLQQSEMNLKRDIVLILLVRSQDA